MEALMEGTLGSRIKALRKKRGWTQEELAAMIRKTRTHVSSMENNRVNPPSDVLLLVAEVLGTSFSYLVGVTDNSLPSDVLDELAGIVDLEISDEDLTKNMNITIDGDVVDKREMDLVVTFLRSIRDAGLVVVRQTGG
jgi:transcriptional regulator with XRE-family HTH domain